MDKPIERVFIIRRNLDTAFSSHPDIHLWNFAHSALLLKTRSDEWFVLEYMSLDLKTGIAYLYPVEITSTAPHGEAVAERVTLTPVDSGKLVFKWTKQKIGTKAKDNVTPADAFKIMETEMKGVYSMTERNCHAAQQHTFTHITE